MPIKLTPIERAERIAKEKAFKRKIKDLVKNADNLDREGIKRTGQLIRDLQKRITFKLTDEALEGWDVTHLPRLKNAVNQAVNEFNTQYGNVLTGLQSESFDLGISSVDDLMRAELSTFALPELDRTLLGIWQGYSADLVTGITEDTRKLINNELTLGITGEKSPFQVIKALGKKVKGYAWEKGTPYDKAMRRAEVITRTEISRVLNLSTNARQKQLGEVYPKARKYWMQTPSRNPRSTHAAVERATNPAEGGTPILVNEKFIVAGIKAMGPHDPSLPAKEVVQCSCRSIVLPPELAEEIKQVPIETTPEFVPAKTIKDAEEWAKRNNIPILPHNANDASDIIADKILKYQKFQFKKLGYDEPPDFATKQEIKNNWLKSFRKKKGYGGKDYYQNGGNAFTNLDEVKRLDLQNAVNATWNNTKFKKALNNNYDPYIIFRNFESNDFVAGRFQGGTIHISNNPFMNKLRNEIPTKGRGTSGSWGGLEAEIRHEYAHGIYDYTSKEFNKKFINKLNKYTNKDIENNITMYASKNSAEAFCELFSIGTSEKYNPSNFNGWVNDLINMILKEYGGE